MAIVGQTARKLLANAGGLSGALRAASPAANFVRRYADEGLLKTPLHDFHVEQGGKLLKSPIVDKTLTYIFEHSCHFVEEAKLEVMNCQ